MSWLDPKIKNVLNKNGDAEINAALAQMMGEVLAEYQNRRDGNRLRVSAPSGEGIFYGARENSITNPETNSLELTCAPVTITRGREEAFSRALFNQRQLHSEEAGALNLLSYEAPLLRQNQGLGGNICKLDLVGLAQNALWAIEYKHTCGPATTVRYGILEALAYGTLMAKHIHDNADLVCQQVHHCLEHRGPYPGDPIVFNAATSIKFSVAGPQPFFQEDTRTDRRMDLTVQFTQAACHYAALISQQLHVPLEFGGLWLINNHTLVQPPPNAEWVVPQFNPPMNPVALFANIMDLHEHIADA